MYLEFFKRIFYILFTVTKELLNILEITTEHQKWPKISTNSVKSLGQNPPHELEVSPRSGLYLLVFI